VVQSFSTVIGLIPVIPSFINKMLQIKKRAMFITPPEILSHFDITINSFFFFGLQG
jgi:hypothetical protein